MARTIRLTVNGAPIPLDRFVRGFLEHTASGMAEALEGTGSVDSMTLSIDGDDVQIAVNGRPVSINAFVMKIVKSTTLGMLSPLKGITIPVNRVRLDISG